MLDVFVIEGKITRPIPFVDYLVGEYSGKDVLLEVQTPGLRSAYVARWSERLHRHKIDVRTPSENQIQKLILNPLDLKNLVVYRITRT